MEAPHIFFVLTNCLVLSLYLPVKVWRVFSSSTRSLFCVLLLGVGFSGICFCAYPLLEIKARASFFRNFNIMMFSASAEPINPSLTLTSVNASRNRNCLVNRFLTLNVSSILIDAWRMALLLSTWWRNLKWLLIGSMYFYLHFQLMRLSRFAPYLLLSWLLIVNQM